MPHEQALDRQHAARLVLPCYPPLFGQGVLTAPADLPHGGGFSGTSVFHLQLSLGAFCLRAWPAGDSPEQVAFRHHLMHLARLRGLSFVPALVAPHQGLAACPWAVSELGRLWDLSEWMPGQADFWSKPTPARLEAACQALAQVHCTWEGLALPAPAPCPAIERRLALLEQSRPLLERRDLLAAIPEPLRPLVEAARSLLSGRLEQAGRMVEPWRMRLWRLQPCLCDVWHDHLLFSGSRLTGLVDYGAVKMDQVAVDLARLLGSLVEDDREGWQVGLAAYRRIRTLEKEEEALAGVLDRSGTILALANWIGRLSRPLGVPANLEGVRRRMQRLVRRVEVWGKEV